MFSARVAWARRDPGNSELLCEQTHSDRRRRARPDFRIESDVVIGADQFLDRPMVAGHPSPNIAACQLDLDFVKSMAIQMRADRRHNLFDCHSIERAEV